MLHPWQYCQTSSQSSYFNLIFGNISLSKYFLSPLKIHFYFVLPYGNNFSPHRRFSYILLSHCETLLTTLHYHPQRKWIFSSFYSHWIYTFMSLCPPGNKFYPLVLAHRKFTCNCRTPMEMDVLDRGVRLLNVIPHLDFKIVSFAWHFKLTVLLEKPFWTSTTIPNHGEWPITHKSWRNKPFFFKNFGKSCVQLSSQNLKNFLSLKILFPLYQTRTFSCLFLNFLYIFFKCRTRDLENLY